MPESLWRGSATPRLRALLLAGSLLVAAGVFSPQPGPGAGLVSAGVASIGLAYAERQVFEARLGALHRLRVRWRLEEPLVEGRETRVRIVLENPTMVTLEHVEVYEQPPPLFQATARPRWCITIPARGRAVLEYTVKPVLGRHRWRPLRLTVEDPLGLYRGERVVETGLPEAKVQPRPLGLSRRQLSLPTILQPGGVSKSRRRGVGSEFMELREYRPGDELRSVDWKASARLGKLVVKVFEQESILNVAIAVDASPQMFRGVVGYTMAEYAARLAASLAEYLARRGDRYSLHLLDPVHARVHSTPWLRGRSTGGYARRWLAENLAWPDPGLLQEGRDVEWGYSPGLRAGLLARRLLRHLPRGRTLVFIVASLTSRAEAGVYAEKLRALLGLRNLVYVVIPLTYSFEARALEPEEAVLYRVLGYQRLRSEVEAVRELRRHGIKAYAALPGDLLAYILSRVEAERGATL